MAGAGDLNARSFKCCTCAQKMTCEKVGGWCRPNAMFSKVASRRDETPTFRRAIFCAQVNYLKDLACKSLGPVDKNMGSEN